MPSPSEISPARAAALLDDLTAIVARACAKISALSAARLIPRLKADQSPVTVADEASEALIIQGVAQLLPGVPVISEESADTQHNRFDGSFLIVDPLDGTREFLAGRDILLDRRFAYLAADRDNFEGWFRREQENWRAWTFRDWRLLRWLDGKKRVGNSE